jgi:hypothetical protein
MSATIFEKFKSLCPSNEAVYFRTILMQTKIPEGAEDNCLANPYRGPKGKRCNILTCPRIMALQDTSGLSIEKGARV